MSGNRRRTLAAHILAALAIAALGCGSDESAVGPDREPPAVVALEPADGATAVPLAAAIRATFSEPVVFDSLQAPLRVEGPGGPIPGTASLDASGTILSFLPASSLASATDYRIVLAPGITDLAGNARADSLTARFTTGFAFLSVGRIFVASLNSRDVRVFDVRTYEPVPGSPVALGFRPVRLRVVPETEEVYVLYIIPPEGAGVLVLDGRTLAVRGDSGTILPPDATDVAVSPADERVFVTAPESNAIYVLDTANLDEAADPIVMARVGSDPTRAAVARRRRLLLVALEGAGQVAGFNLPALTPAAGFPVSAVRQVHSIALDEDRGRAWVGGGLRYAVMDLVNPARTISFQIPNLPGCLAPLCTPRAWSLILSAAQSRAFFLSRVDFISSAEIADLAIVDENWNRFSGIVSDVVQNPRSGELVVVEARSVGAALFRLDPVTLDEVDAPPIPGAGDGPINMGVLP